MTTEEEAKEICRNFFLGLSVTDILGCSGDLENLALVSEVNKILEKLQGKTNI
jgi:hypothetical protein